MDEKETNNEEKKQNIEEEEFDEEDEEEKEADKEQAHNTNNDDKEKEKEKTEDQNTKTTENKDKEPKTSEKIERTSQKEEKNEINNEKEKDVIIDNKENEENIPEEEEEEETIEEDTQSTTAYVLKYTRKSNEPRESAYNKELIKPKNCLFMIEFKIMHGRKNTYLLVYCHEIAAIYFDEIYEKKYSIKDLYQEDRHFRIFDDVKEAKNIVDEILKNNTKNTNKIYIDLKDNTFRLHLNMIFFDKETEIVFNINKKNITDEERIRLLPEFLNEIQIKMRNLEDVNKKLKKNKNLNQSEIIGSPGKLNIEGLDDNDVLVQKNNSSKKVKTINEKSYKKKVIKK